MAREFFSDIPVTDESVRLGVKKAPAVKETVVFTPVKEIVDQYGDVVRVDAQGRDESGNIVFAGADQSKLDKVPTGGGATGGKSDVVVGGSGPQAKKVVSTFVSNGTTYALFDDGSTKVLAQGETVADAEKTKRLGAYNILLDEFNRYGLGSLVSDVKDFLVNGYTAEEIPLALKGTKSYQTRFAANAQRVAKGLSELSPAAYVKLEDAYQSVMRNYGLPSSYYTEVTDPVTGIKRQTGFDQLIAGDVSAPELESRIQIAKDRVLNANPEVLDTLKKYYPSITNGDILAYTLDPNNALNAIKNKVTTAEIGAAAYAQGLNQGTAKEEIQKYLQQAESLAGYGVTGEQARVGYQTVAEMAPRGGQLAAIYNQGPYTQQTAEAEVFRTAGAAEAAKKRKKLTALEQASFGGSSGVGALGRDRVGSQTSGAGTY